MKRRVWLQWLLISAGSLYGQDQISVTEYPISGGGLPHVIAPGPDGALWFTGATSNCCGGFIGRITTSGSITQYSIPNSSNSVPEGITAGPDGAMWFTASTSPCCGGFIGRITMSGEVTEFPLTGNSVPGSITTGPDGALWFTASGFGCPCGGLIGRITTAGVITEFPLPVGSSAGSITAGPDGALWFGWGTATGGSLIGRMNTSGIITNQFPIGAATGGAPGLAPVGLTTGPDGALWFMQYYGGLTRITTAGVVTSFNLKTQFSSFANGPDGAVWAITNGILDGVAGDLIRITPAGAVTYYTLTGLFSPHSDLNISTLTLGPDGALWYTDENGSIGGAIARAVITAVPAPALAAPFPALGNVGASYSSYLNVVGGTPPYSNWTVTTGTVPPGLLVNPSSGAITGLPLTPGTYNFTVTVQDSTGFTSAPQTVSIAILASIPGLSFIGSMPHLAAEENWTTTFTLVNKGSTTPTARLSLFGDPSGTLPLPLSFPQQPAASPLLTASLDEIISANASLVLKTAGPQTPPVQVGSAQVSSTGAVDGFAIFHHVITQQETVVPLETRKANSYVLPFDNTGGSVLGVALALVGQPPGYAGIRIAIRDDAGIQVQQSSVLLVPNGHASFVLPMQFPVTANARGTIEFDTPSGGQISVLGMRFTSPNNALTTIPAMVPGTAGGGSIAHIATGNGWQSTIVLVNTGTAAAPFQLNFFAGSGMPLALPLGFPQTASGSTTVASSVSQTLAPGASLLIQSAAPLSDPAPTIGSAQLTTSGNITGFVIYRYNPNGQEAVVPFENRHASGYILAFDNTGGTATGVAVNNADAAPADVPVILRDDAGNLLATDTVHLAGNGNSAFTLVTDKYSAAANIRGTIEFDTPPGGNIGALAFRIPVAHTFTTLPALAK